MAGRRNMQVQIRTNLSVEIRMSQGGRSTMKASASPPPMHTLARPRRNPLVASSSYNNVVRKRAPEAPIGCHRAGPTRG